MSNASDFSGNATAASDRPRGGGVGRVPLLALFIVLILLVPLVGIAALRLYTPQLRQDVYANLEAIAALKAGQIETWLAERDGDGRIVKDDPDFVRRVDRLLRAERDAGNRAQVQAYLDRLRGAFGYDGVALMTGDGHVLLSSGTYSAADAGGRGPGGGSVTAGEGRIAARRDTAGQLYLDWVAPIPPSSRALAATPLALVFRIDPGKFIYPLIQAWPTASPSGETLLVRRDGERALFLNEFRHRKDAALALSIPLDTPGLPAAEAVRANAAGTVDGVDYRGRVVLAAFRPVAGTDWHIVAKLLRIV